MIHIRSEEPEDYSEISEMHSLAFEQDNEARLVEVLRSSPDFIHELSLVAVLNGLIVGHILFSKIIIQSENRRVSALALAPMAVRPKYQNSGIRSQLVIKGIKECRSLGYGIVIVIGHPDYYPRFGFKPARALGVKTSFDVPDQAFLIREVIPSALDSVSGTVVYPSSFDIAL
ncbi:MAG: GNAT family N-acetyltransferase [Candidatus Jordarchaeum sp.]|uniref:GNAT family N-acetyltransferase n=1 Tax=Candidatus Jordarchaeum sp. TaxID=2823881 RepID=UPI00404A5554